MPDDHSKLVPLLPIPNRTVKRLSADDSADSRVKVGHRQALIVRITQPVTYRLGDVLAKIVKKPAPFDAGFLLFVPSSSIPPNHRNWRLGA